jgi:beta-galactosidase
MKDFIFLYILLLPTVIFSQRATQGINNNWEFCFPGQDFQSINLPHTYNTADPFDDEPGYYRGKALYRKVLNTELWSKDAVHYIKFNAVNQHALVWINGVLVGEHKGGYTAFLVEISEHLHFKQDTLLVEVDNSHDEAVPPLKGDFNFYGGIYRSVEHLALARTHIAANYFGTDGVFIDPISISDTSAQLGLRVYVENLDSTRHGLIAELWSPYPHGGVDSIYGDFTYDEQNKCWYQEITIQDPQLWSLEDPNLYRFEVSIIGKTKKATPFGKVSVKYGLRDFYFDADQGFFLNGKHEKLIGVNRHQDRPGIGNALTVDQHVQDMDIIREMGANFLRTAHYPQDQVITDYCDANGILVSMEIPLDHEISEHPDFNDNCKHMMLEMIHQYYNHPSVIIWAYMNEMGLWKDAQRDSLHMTKVADLARELESLTRKADPHRYTMMPNHGYFDIYPEFGLTDIPMIIGWNLYHGWYVPDMDSFGEFVDRAHRLVPDKPMIITEYGAGADPRISSFSPKRFDFSVNWSLEFHRSHLQQILDRDFIAGSAVWNMFDFGSETRNDAVPHINNKGLCSFDRQAKAPFYLYQKHLRRDRYIQVPYPGPAFVLRDPGTEGDIPEEFDGLIYTPDQFWSRYSVLNINFGTDYYFSEGGMNWVPDSEVPASIMTRVGGDRAEVRDIGYGTDKAISMTNLDPVYQTWIENPKEIQFFLPRGTYKLIFHLSNNRPKESASINILCRYDSDISKIDVGQLESFRAYRYESVVEVRRSFSINIFGFGLNPFSFINGIQIIRL